MFHKSVYGILGDHLPSDLNGYVPEPGDHYLEFRWPKNITNKLKTGELGKEWWSQMIAEAEYGRERLETQLGIYEEEDGYEYEYY